MTEPRTEAGRDYLAALVISRWGEREARRIAILRIEDEAAEAALATVVVRPPTCDHDHSRAAYEVEPTDPSERWHEGLDR